MEHCRKTTVLKQSLPYHSGVSIVPFHQSVRIALDYILSYPEERQVPDPEFDAWCDRVIAALEKAKEDI